MQRVIKIESCSAAMRSNQKQVVTERWKVWMTFIEFSASNTVNICAPELKRKQREHLKNHTPEMRVARPAC